MKSVSNSHKEPQEMVALRQRRLAVLGAMVLFMATIEYMIPKPLPFLKLGVANLPILIGLTFLSPKEVLILLVMKVVGQGLIHGTLFSHLLLFSFGGTFSSGLVMMLLYYAKVPKVSLIGISVSGAITGNIMQLLVAQILLFGKDVWLMAPIFLGAGVISSTILGIMALRFTQHSKWVEKVKIP